MEQRSYLEQLWARGQEHLAAGRYAAAVGELQIAEGAAWRKRDAVALARVYLPLLEARRQIRYQAAEGTILICDPRVPLHDLRALVRGFLHDRRIAAGTLLLASALGPDVAHRLAGSLHAEARRTARSLETLLLVMHGSEVRLAAAANATFAAGLPVKWTNDQAAAVGPSTDPRLVIPLPPPGRYHAASPMQVVARESLIVAWEALALKWQHRHPPLHGGGPWEEIAWLRLALRIDPACEPVTMRLIALADAAARHS